MVCRSISQYEVVIYIFLNVWPDSLIYITRHNFLLCLMKVFHLSIPFLISSLLSFLPSLPHLLSEGQINDDYWWGWSPTCRQELCGGGEPINWRPVVWGIRLHPQQVCPVVLPQDSWALTN